MKKSIYVALLLGAIIPNLKASDFEGKQRLDSILCVKDGVLAERNIFSYNSQGWIAMEKDYSKKDNQWELNYTKEYVYPNPAENKGYFISSTVKDGNATPFAKEEFAYDELGNRTLSALYSFDAYTNSWMGSLEKREYFFDDKGRECGLASYRWNRDSNTWEGSYKFFSQMNDQDTIVHKCEYLWVDNDWSLQQEISYDEDGNPTHSLAFQYEDEYGNITPFYPLYLTR